MKTKVKLCTLVVLLAVLSLGTWSVLANYEHEESVIWTPPEQEETIAGAWLASLAPFAELGQSLPLKIQQTWTPFDPSGNRLAYRETSINLPPGQAGTLWSDFVGTAVKTGPSTYEFRSYGYATLVPEPREDVERGEIVNYAVLTGKSELTDRDTRYESEVYFILYGPDADVDPADGFPDESAEPLFFQGPMEGQWYNRVRMMPLPEPPAPEAP